MVGKFGHKVVIET